MRINSTFACCKPAIEAPLESRRVSRAHGQALHPEREPLVTLEPDDQ
jgi:hypothetical protein